MPTTTNLYVKNSDIIDYLGKEKTYLTVAVATGGTTLTVRDNVGFANDEFMGIGEPGSPRSEIKKIGATVTVGTSITTGATTFAHPIDTPIYRLPGDQLKYERASTKTGTKSDLATVDIDWNLKETRYADTTDTTGFFWVKIYNSGTSAEISDYFGAWNYIQFNIDSFGAAKYLALKREGEKYSRLITDEWLDREIQAYRNHMKRKMNLDLEIGQDTSLSLVTDQWRYDMPSGIKTPKGDRGVIFVRLGVHGNLDPLTWPEYLDKLKGTTHSQVATQALAGDTSLVLDNTYEFDDPDSGTAALLVDGQNLTYTTNTESTSTLSGIPASGTGSITATIAVDKDAWQDLTDGLPGYYCIWDGYLYLWNPSSSSYNGRTITIDYWKDDSTTLTRTDSLDVVSELAATWLQWRIKEARADGNFKDKRSEFYALRNEYFGTERTNLGTRFDVDINDQNTYSL